jgi:integrase
LGLLSQNQNPVLTSNVRLRFSRNDLTRQPLHARGNEKHQFIGLRWKNPFTGREHQKSSKTNDLELAQKRAIELEQKLNSGKYHPEGEITWEDFRDRWEIEREPNISKNSQIAYEGSLNIFEREMRPAYFTKIDSSIIAQFTQNLKKTGIRNTTINKHLRHIKAVLRWSVNMGIIEKVPYIEMLKTPKGSKLMKGRPINASEFERMLEAVPKVVKLNEMEHWRRLLEGLWWSGLRISEAINLDWTRSDKFMIDITHPDFPVFRIPGEMQKNGVHQTCTIATEFVAMMQQVPEAERNGAVFKLPICDRIRKEDWQDKISKIICRIGKESGVVVHVEANTQKKKYVSSHDLRRAFGARWSERALPQVLKQLKRHDVIKTTMNYYVGQDDKRTWKILTESVKN